MVLLVGSGTDELLAALCEEAHLQRMPTPVRGVFAVFAQALDTATVQAHPGDTVLFSPGFTSFGLFRNEFDRGDQFVAYVTALEK
ncbi:MAG: hypothetical protein JO125_09075 [Chloroflexi bacterium]|nr:hypothetical protein [Chloroflexota bacterium]